MKWCVTLVFFAAPQQPVRKLPRAAKKRNVSIQRRDQRPLRKHTGDRHVPATIPAKSGRSHRTGAGFPQVRVSIAIQGTTDPDSFNLSFSHTHKNMLQNVLFSIGSAFLYYVNHFKLYSSFCASHSKAQKVLHPSEYEDKRAFEIEIENCDSRSRYGGITWEMGVCVSGFYFMARKRIGKYSRLVICNRNCKVLGFWLWKALKRDVYR